MRVNVGFPRFASLRVSEHTNLTWSFVPYLFSQPAKEVPPESYML